MVLPGTVDQGSQTLQVPSLPLSAKGQSMCLLGEQGVILEVQQYKTLYSSWLIGDRFSADGGLFLCTALDPLFVLLSLLEARPAQVRRTGSRPTARSHSTAQQGPGRRRLQMRARLCPPCRAPQAVRFGLPSTSF